jgi:hypothetical protein
VSYLDDIAFSRSNVVAVGSTAKTDGDAAEQQRIQDLQVALLKLPRIHLLVLDAIVKHLRT